MSLDRLRNRHFFFLDLLLLPVAAYLSFVLRLESFDLDFFWLSFFIYAILVTVVTPIFFQRAGIYSRFWRYASVNELLLLAGTVTVATLVTGLIGFSILYIMPGEAVLPRSVPLIFLFLALAVTAGPRLAVRALSHSQLRGVPADRIRVAAIMGAGDAGAMTLRELQRNPQLGLQVVGFVDDAEEKRGVRIHGVPVVGNRYDIPRLVKSFGLDQIIIAMPTAPGREIREIVRVCEEADVETKIIPGIYELLDGTVTATQLRDVDIEDLLRREPIRTDTRAVAKLLFGKRVLITGAGGSIGSELCRQVLRCQPDELILLGHGENSVFQIVHELRAQADASVTIRVLVADIRFPDRLDGLLQRHRPDVIFHAAAHKHVPLMEANPAEAVTNNILGTQYLLRAADAADVERFVMISTDKAVNPTSVMGASKRVAELLVSEAAVRSRRPYVTVRFGNVLGSRGSVVNTFKQQIAAGGPITVTHPEMKRYFMTIPEAVQLVLQAAALGQGDEVFVLDMGEPVKIVDLAHDLVNLSGLEVGHDIEIRFTGIRPGEKLFEELFLNGEQYERTKHEKIFIARHADGSSPADLQGKLEVLAKAARQDDGEVIRHQLKALVPEYDVLLGASRTVPLADTQA